MVLLPEGVSPLGGVVPLLGLMSLLLRCPYGEQNVGWYLATIHVPYMYGAWEVREDYWTKV